MIQWRTYGLIFLAVFICAGMAMARNLDVQLRIVPQGEGDAAITRDNLLRVKQFILQSGMRETYCNRYNNNPAYHTKGFHFYLNPDSGQQNTNCDPEKSDFNNLTIRSVAGGQIQYRTVEFLEQHTIYVTANNPTDNLTVGQLRAFVEDALTELLAEIEQKEPNKTSEHFSEGRGGASGNVQR